MGRGEIDSAGDRTICAIGKLWLTLTILAWCSLVTSPHAHGMVRSSDSTGWFWQNPLPQGNTLYDVTTLNAGVAIAVGGSGTIIETSDGGATWNVMKTVDNIRTAFRSVSFINPTTGWVAGENGKVYFTNTGGASWITRGQGLGSVTLNAVKFVSATRGWTVGKFGYIFSTTNGGSSWVSQPSGVVTDLYDVSAVSDSVAYSVGDFGALRKTVNGGASWDSVVSVISDYRSSFFVDKNNGWLTDYVGRIFRTTTGGDTWSSQPSGIDPALGVALYDIKFFNSSPIGIAAGEKGYVTITNTGGNAGWSSQTLDSTVTITGVAVRSPSFAWLVGGQGHIWESNNSGSAWSQKSSGFTADVTDLSFPDANLGWAVGVGGMVMSTLNGGRSWGTQTSGVLTRLNGIAMVSPLKGYAAGDAGTLITTANGGTSWSIVPLVTARTLHGIRSGDATHAIAVGDNGTIVRTTDGGATWISSTVDQAVTFLSVAFSTSFNAWTVGDSAGIGKIYTTSDAGASWSSVPIEPSLQLTDVFFINPLAGVAVGVKSNSNAKILVTTDGGNLWTPRSSPEAANFRRVYFANAKTGWIAGDGGTMLKTVNGGQTWNSLLSGVEGDLTAVQFVDTLVGWIAGGGGSILKSIDGGGPMTDFTPPPPPDDKPQAINILTNYPNPFNPGTHLVFQITKPTEVTIFIYDLLGRKVKEILLGYTASGIHDAKSDSRLTWDGNDSHGRQLPSGVYFFTLVTTEFRQTSKMLMIR